jgi:cell division protein FtsB
VKPRVLLLGGVVIATMVVGYTFLSSDGWREKSRLQQEQAALEGRVKQLQADNAQLAEQARALRDERPDNRVLEEAVRSELGYVKKDEVVILTGDDGVAKEAGAPPEGPQETP